MLWRSFVRIYEKKSWVERRSTMFKNSTPHVISNKMSMLELAFHGEKRFLFAQLRTNSHQLWCETSWWKRPKEGWE